MKRSFATDYQAYKALRSGGPLRVIFSMLEHPEFFGMLGLLDHDIFVSSARNHFNAVAIEYIQNVASEAYMLAALHWQSETLPDQLARMKDTIRSESPIRITDIGAGAGAVSSWPAIDALLQYRGIKLKQSRIALTLYDVSDDMKFVTRELDASSLPAELRCVVRDPDEVLQRVKSARYLDYDIASLRAPPAPHPGQPQLRQHIVICSFVLHHLGLYGKLQALRNLSDLLREDGVLILVDEFRNHQQQMDFLQEIRRSEERLGRQIPYGMESFVDELWFRSAIKEPGIDLAVLAAAPTTPDGRLIGLLLGKNRS